MTDETEEFKPSYPRHRSEAGEPTYALFTKTSGPNKTYFDSHLSITSQEDKVMDDVVVPSYTKRIALGHIINNPCTYGRTSLFSGFGTYQAVNTSTGDEYGGSGGSMTGYQRHLTGVPYLETSELSLPEPGSLEKEAKFYAIAHIDPTPYAFAEDAGEIRETLKFVSKPFSSLLRMGKNFEKEVYRRHIVRNKYGGKPVFGKSKLKFHAADVAGAWAEFRFAAAPLVRSAMDALEAATWYKDITPPKRKTARGFVMRTEQSFDDKKYYWDGNTYDVYHRVITADIDVSAGVLYQVSNPVEDLSWRLGMRVKDVPETIWQLLPLSFMVDRFIDISRTIRGVTNLLDPRVHILAGWTTSRSEVEQTIRFNNQVVPGWTVSVNGDKQGELNFTYVRTPWQPSLSDAVPNVTPLGLVKDATSTLDLISVTSRLWNK